VAVLVVVAMLPALAHAQDTGGGTIATGDPDADALIAEIERVTAGIVEVKEQLHSDHLDPDALLDTIGRNPSGILEWVATETRWLPYEGALRGARGVLMDRSGSSLDRALLLADLLERSGLEVRLANTTLPEGTASSLASAALERPWAPVSDPVFAAADEVEGFRASVGSAAEELASEVGLLAGPATDRLAPADAIADHWWVQASSQGQWEDYDPLFAADAAARPAAGTTIDPADLPGEVRHSVTLRVVIERYEDEALIEDVVLEHTVLMGGGEPNKPIELDFDVSVPHEFADRASQTTDIREGARLSAFWRPRLEVDGQSVTGDWFSRRGRIEPPGAPAQAAALSEGLEGLTGLGSEPAEQDTVDSMLTATWIEYETVGPGIEPRTERREILDLVGAPRDGAAAIDGQALASDEADVRRGLAFLGESAVLLQAAATHPDAFLDAYLETWIELRPALIALVFLRAGVEDERIGPSLATPRILPIDLLAMTSARDRWAMSRVAYVGRPQIWSRHSFYDSVRGEASSSLAVDIVMNDTDVIPSAGRDPRMVRLEQGILDTLVEHVLGATPGGLNTWERFSRRAAEGMAWTVLRPGSDPEAGLADTLPPSDLARMRAALARGDSVVVATEPRLRGDVPFADWWRISENGTALGIGYRGWGQDLTEEGATTQPSLQTLKLRQDQERVEETLRMYREAAEQGRRQGLYDPHAHLRGPRPPGSKTVDPFADTLPIINSLSF